MSIWGFEEYSEEALLSDEMRKELKPSLVISSVE